MSSSSSFPSSSSPSQSSSSASPSNQVTVENKPPSIWTNIASQWTSSLQPIVIQLVQLYIVQVVDTGNRVRDNLIVSAAVIVLQIVMVMLNSFVSAIWTTFVLQEEGKTYDEIDDDDEQKNAIVSFVQSIMPWNTKQIENNDKSSLLINHQKVQAYVNRNYKTKEEFTSKLTFQWRIFTGDLQSPSNLFRAYLSSRTTGYVLPPPTAINLHVTDYATDLKEYNQDNFVNTWFKYIHSIEWGNRYFPIGSYVKNKHKHYIYGVVNNDASFMLFSESEIHGIQCYNEFYQYCQNNASLLQKTGESVIQNYIPNIRSVKLHADGTISANNSNTVYAKSIRFEHLAFDDKSMLLEWLTKFRNRTIYPPKLNMSSKLGILLYGPPGTGKSACAVAIASHLSKNIYTIDSTIIPCGFQSFIGYLNSHINGIHMFDEFDDFVKQLIKNELAQQRQDQDQESDLEQYCKLLAVLEDKKNKEKNKDNDNDSRSSAITMGTKTRPLTMTDFIRALDSIYNDSGRVIVATTNHISELSSVLLRPGRFDLKIEMGYCSANMVREILDMAEKWPSADICPDFVERIVRLKVTPLVFINAILISDTLDELLEKVYQNLKFDNGAHQMKAIQESQRVVKSLDSLTDDDNVSTDDTQSL